MKYNSRNELELIGKTGAYSYEGNFTDKAPYKVSRLISSYWVCTRPKGPDLAEHLMNDGYWESWVTLWMSNNVKPGSVCIDAGANYGYYTFFLAQHGCKVISIEANSELMKYLQKSVELNSCQDRVKLMNKAVTDKSWETIYLNVKEDVIGGSTILEADTGKKLPVETIMLNDLLMIEPRIDFLKMDIEGAEEKAWSGIKKLFEYNKDFIALIEFSPVCYQNSGRDFFYALQKDYQVSYVDSDGSDKPVIDFSFFEKNIDDLQMLVIRGKHHGMNGVK